MDLIELCEKGNYEKIKEIIMDDSLYIDFQTYDQLFSCAVSNNHDKITELLIKHHITSSNIDTGFYYAGLNNNKKIIYLLLEKQSDLAKKSTHNRYESHVGDLLYLICGICEGGHLKLFKKLIKDEIISKELLCRSKTRIFECACRGGNKDMINFLIEYNLHDWYQGFIAACRAGQFEIAKWIYKEANGNDVDYVNIIFTHGARGGNLQLILWAKKIVEHEDYKYGPGIPWDTIFNLAAEEGHLEIVTWVAENQRKYVDLYEGFRHACSNGKKSVADWLIEKSKKQSWKTWPIYTKMSTYSKPKYYTYATDIFSSIFQN